MESSHEVAHQSRAAAISGNIMVVAIVMVCLIILFLLFLHLYAKWFWWQVEEPPAPRRQRRRRRFVFAPGQETSLCTRPFQGLDPTVLGSLPVILFNRKEFRDEDGMECAVCLCEVVDGETTRILPKCDHGFHVDCIDMWFQSHATCPLCRNPVAGGESVSSDSGESGNVADNGLVHNAGTENLASGYLIETPRLPANVLFWGNETQVSSFGACLEQSGSVSGSHSLVIDVSVDETEDENVAEEEAKSPMPTRLKTLKRLLSRERRAASTSSSSSPDT